MSRVVIGHTNYSDVGVSQSPVLADGLWESLLPLSNAQDRRIDVVARSQNAALTSTQFTVDLGTSRDIRLISIWNHNGSSAALGRARAYTAQPVANKIDLSDATVITTPIRVAASYNANGVILDSLQDDNVSSAEGYKWVAGWTADATKILEFEIRKNTSTSSVIRVRDVTAGANRLLGAITWSGTVAVVTMTTGTLISSTLIADGVYRVVVLTTSVTAANANEIEFYPATDAALAIGSTGLVYAGNFSWFNAATDQRLYDSLFTAAYPTGQTAETLEGLNIGWRHIASANQSARFWRFNIADPANADGYFEFGRLFVMAAWQPTINMSYGANLGVDDPTTDQISDGGAALYDPKRVCRRLSFALNDLPATEVLDNGFAMQLRCGVKRQIFVAYDPDDSATLMHYRAFPGVMREMSALEFPYHARASIAYNIREEI